jgi:predicted hotdog family 3-hydroxylacyl-ACP dehydratase
MHIEALDHLLPHAGQMRLLAEVLDWNEQTIECRAVSHRAADNPLRLDGALPALCGLEYGAQAMAIHGALIAARADKPRLGLLVSAHELVCHIDRLDTVEDDLRVVATRLLGSAQQVAYSFEVHAAASAGVPLVSGRASVILAIE